MVLRRRAIGLIAAGLLGSTPIACDSPGQSPSSRQGGSAFGGGGHEGGGGDWGSSSSDDDEGSSSDDDWGSSSDDDWGSSSDDDWGSSSDDDWGSSSDDDWGSSSDDDWGSSSDDDWGSSSDDDWGSSSDDDWGSSSDDDLHCEKGPVPDVDVEFGCDGVYVRSCKDLSNVVLFFEDGTTQRFEDLDGETGTFAGTGENAGKVIVTVWVKSGRNHSGDGPGYGERFDNPNPGACGDVCEDGSQPELVIGFHCTWIQVDYCLGLPGLLLEFADGTLAQFAAREAQSGTYQGSGNDAGKEINGVWIDGQLYPSPSSACGSSGPGGDVDPQ